MNIHITGKRIDVTDAMKEYVEKKITKLAKNLTDVIDVNVTMHLERYRHVAEITISAHHLTVRGKGDTTDMYTSIDMACARIEKQLARYRGRIQARRAPRAEKLAEATMTVYDHQALAGEADTRVVVKVDKISVKPMAIEEAVMEMDLLNQDFLVFKNAETDEVNVIYHRRDGDVGLIEP